MKDSRFEFRGRRVRLELRGWRADLIVWVLIAPIALFPAACAFFAYAEGRRTRAAVAYSVALPVSVVVWVGAAATQAKLTRISGALTAPLASGV